MAIQIKRIYDPVEESDGIRLLVDRLWPRGISKERAHLDGWVIYLDTVHPGCTPEQVKDNCMFNLNISRVSGETPTPTYHELDLLYNKVDAEGIFLP